MASRAWSKGWPNQNLPPLDRLMAAEREAQQAAVAHTVARMDEQTRAQVAIGIVAGEAVQADAIAFQAMEAVGIREALRAGQALVSGYASLAEAMRPLLARVETALRKLGREDGDDAEQLTMDDVLTLLERLASIGQKLVATQHQAMQSHRLHVGEATEKITVQREMTPDEVIHRLRLAAKAADRLERKYGKAAEVIEVEAE